MQFEQFQVTAAAIGLHLFGVLLIFNIREREGQITLLDSPTESNEWRSCPSHGRMDDRDESEVVPTAS